MSRKSAGGAGFGGAGGDFVLCTGYTVPGHEGVPVRVTRRIRVVDSHTAGEPTRAVVAGGPDLGGGSVADRCRRFRDEFDAFRSLVVNEPRGSDVLVGALLVPPADPDCAAGVIFFN